MKCKDCCSYRPSDFDKDWGKPTPLGVGGSERAKDILQECADDIYEERLEESDMEEEE